MAHHRIFLDSSLHELPEQVTLDGPEAAHAVLVKRIEPGQLVELRDGRGGHATATVTGVARPKRGATITLAIGACSVVPRCSPLIHVFSAVPKGDRAAQLIDQLSQVGASSWRWLRSSRAVAEATDNKRERLYRIAVEAAKQCGRAWILTVDEPLDIRGAIDWLGGSPASRGLVLADGKGTPAHAWFAAQHDPHRAWSSRPGTHDAPSQPPAQGPWSGSEAAREIALLIGPEGGFDDQERDELIAGGAVPLRFGPHIMRTETAAVAAAGCLRLAFDTANEKAHQSE